MLPGYPRYWSDWREQRGYITSILWVIRYRVDPKVYLAIPDAGQIGEGIEGK